MSYDITVAAHKEPRPEMLEAWTLEHGLEVATIDGGRHFAITNPARHPESMVCEVWGPDPAESEDFEEELAAACLDPRWMLQVSTSYSFPRENVKLAASLATHLAQSTDGAAFDPQQGKLIWPRGKPQRLPRLMAPRETSMLRMDWFMAPSRWSEAVQNLVPLLARRFPNALPTRYGQWEPPPLRFDRSHPEPFVAFLASSEDGQGFWYAERPSFGGSFLAPHGNKFARSEEESYRVGRIEVSFDGELISADERLREAVVGLFVRGSELFGAFFAAAQVEPGVTVGRGNRPFATAKALFEGEHFLRGMLWQGLPTVPLWLSWYGGPYRDLVARSLGGAARSNASMLQRIRSRLVGGEARMAPSEATVETREAGIFVRLTRQPLPRSRLPTLPLSRDLTYSERRATKSRRGIESNPAQPEDRAAVIPELDSPPDAVAPSGQVTT